METTAKNSISARLVKALANIDRPGTFCVGGSAPAVLPGLEMKGIGALGLPATASQIKELKKCCEQAPYGKGTETLVDTSVRRVWRMTPDRFKLTNPDWNAFIDETVARVQAQLGLEKQKLEAHLYDLLLYEKGGFFLPHRDGEKLDRMVATLVVVLPSIFEGGELVVRHEGREKTIDFGGESSQFKTHFAAFYADCEHEVKPLRSGNRLCLIYNLTLAAAKKTIGAPRSAEHIGKIVEILADWKTAAEAPPKLAVTLEHRYTQDGLSWDALKGADGAKARILAEAAEEAGCQAFLALLTFWESGWSEEYDDYGYGRRSRYRGSWHEEEEEEEEEDEENDDDGSIEGKHSMSEVFDSSLTVENWQTPDGDRPPLGKIPVEPNEVAPPESLRAVKPEEDFQGFTGNEGMTLDRWYRHAVVCLWPRERDLDVLCQAGSREALPALKQMVSSWRHADGAAAEALKARCIEFAGKILANWPETPYRSWRDGDDDQNLPDPMASLNHLGDPQLIRTYFRDVLVRDASLEPGKATVKVLARHGWATFHRELAKLFKATTVQTLDRNSRLLEHICLAAAEDKSRREAAHALETCRLIAQTLLDALPAIDADTSNDWRLDRVERGPILGGLTQALLAAQLDDLLATLVAHIQKTPSRYELRKVQLPALASLRPWLKENSKRRPKALLHWLADARQQLESFTAAIPQPPADLRREADVKCTCEDCRALKRFLNDPHGRETGFRMAESRRKHLASNIRSFGCDLDCRTEKRGNPHTLICTKNTASYERRLKQYHEDLKSLAMVKTIANDV